MLARAAAGRRRPGRAPIAHLAGRARRAPARRHGPPARRRVPAPASWRATSTCWSPAADEIAGGRVAAGRPAARAARRALRAADLLVVVGARRRRRVTRPARAAAASRAALHAVHGAPVAVPPAGRPTRSARPRAAASRACSPSPASRGRSASSRRFAPTAGRWLPPARSRSSPVHAPPTSRRVDAVAGARARAAIAHHREGHRASAAARRPLPLPRLARGALELARRTRGAGGRRRVSRGAMRPCTVGGEPRDEAPSRVRRGASPCAPWSALLPDAVVRAGGTAARLRVLPPRSRAPACRR